jgi:peptidoglycan/xylan/chitin deacetylase (PgdA/CDA1 family)
MRFSLLRQSLYGVLHIFLGFLPDRAPRILMYHSVGGGSPSAVGRDEFEWQMAYVAQRFRIIPLSQLFNSSWTKGRPLACITFDDGFASVFEHAVPVLASHGISATFFATTGYLGTYHPTFYGKELCMSIGQLRDLVRSGHEAGGHTVSHPKLANIPSGIARKEIEESKATLEVVTGAPVTSFAYPKGSYIQATKALVAAAGFGLAVTIREGSCDMHGDRFALPRIAVDATTSRIEFKGKLSRALYAYEFFKKLYGHAK